MGEIPSIRRAELKPSFLRQVQETGHIERITPVEPVDQKGDANLPTYREPDQDTSRRIQKEEEHTTYGPSGELVTQIPVQDNLINRKA